MLQFDDNDGRNDGHLVINILLSLDKNNFCSC